MFRARRISSGEIAKKTYQLKVPVENSRPRDKQGYFQIPVSLSIFWCHRFLVRISRECLRFHEWIAKLIMPGPRDVRLVERDVASRRAHVHSWITYCVPLSVCVVVRKIVRKIYFSLATLNLARLKYAQTRLAAVKLVIRGCWWNVAKQCDQISSFRV